MKKLRPLIWIIIAIKSTLGTSAQTFRESLWLFTETGVPPPGIVVSGVARLQEFYRVNNGSPLWSKDSMLRYQLWSLLSQSADWALNRDEYQFGFISKSGVVNGSDSLETELRYCDAALHFAHDLAYGNDPPATSYDGLRYVPACRNLVDILRFAIFQKNLHQLPTILSPLSAEYGSAIQLYRRFRQVVDEPGFEDVRIGSNKVSAENTYLVKRLRQFGTVDSFRGKLPDSTIRNGVKRAQRMFNLLADGVLRATALEAFNYPLAQRVKELSLALNTLRWLSCIKQRGRIIIVNIPSANLLLYEGGVVALESRLVVGKPATPTPLLNSLVSEVILYPYWVVPQSIAVNELLPNIKRQVSYLELNGYQVIDKSGKLLDPKKINWSRLGSRKFPYTIRQTTGCDNALGLVKLNFFNPFSVYLHDTPTKPLFGLNRRYFSHGCMRVEKAIEVGRDILGENAIAIDTLTEKGCLFHQSPVIVPLANPVPVFVLYQTAWVDSSGRVGFYEDVYKKHAGHFRQ